MMLRALADVVEQAGVSPAAVFQGEEKSLSSGQPIDFRVSLSTYHAFFSRAVELTRDPALGLRTLRQASESAFDVLTPLVAHAPTLRHAIQEIMQFQALAFDGAVVQLTERSGVARLRCEFPRAVPTLDRSLAEFMTAGMARMVRRLGCSQSEFQGAFFEHKPPSYYQVYAQVFEGKVHFAQKFTGIEFAAHVLDRPHSHANPELHTLVHKLAEQRLGRLSRPAGIIERLRMYLLSKPATTVPSMATASRELGVSVRTLRRRLSEENLTFRDLTQTMQGERACSMLRNPDLSLQAISDALGFTDTSAFFRAFKRWTGRTASEYRGAT
jgi:AraC-like DNA-binding protein